MAGADKRRATSKQTVAPAHSAETRCYVGLGGNLGDALRTLRQAAIDLDEIPNTRVVARSGIFVSAPVGPPGQRDYLNAVIALCTRLPATQLLKQLQRLENNAGRERSVRWGARTLDLDLLLYGDEVIDSPTLTVPHPRISERNFVLLPLSEVLDPQDTLPRAAKSIHELIENCPANAITRTSHTWPLDAQTQTAAEVSP